MTKTGKSIKNQTVHNCPFESETAIRPHARLMTVSSRKAEQIQAWAGSVLIAVPGQQQRLGSSLISVPGPVCGRLYLAEFQKERFPLAIRQVDEIRSVTYSEIKESKHKRLTLFKTVSARMR